MEYYFWIFFIPDANLTSIYHNKSKYIQYRQLNHKSHHKHIYGKTKHTYFHCKNENGNKITGKKKKNKFWRRYVCPLSFYVGYVRDVYSTVIFLFPLSIQHNQSWRGEMGSRLYPRAMKISIHCSVWNNWQGKDMKNYSW